MAKTTKSFRVSFTLDEKDVGYFKRLFRAARKKSANVPQDEILAAANDLVKTVRSSERVPHFVLDAVTAIEDLTQVITDEEYKAPKSVRSQVLGALAYFSNPDDLIPDEIPVLGFLDDAIMIKFVEEEFRHELWAYRKFRRFRAGAEVRPWTPVATSRLPGRLDAMRKKLRSQVNERRARDAAKGKLGF